MKRSLGMYAALEYLKKETINEVVCNKSGITHVTDSYARAAGKRFCIEASVREIERVSHARQLQRMAKHGLQHEGQQFLHPHWFPCKSSPWDQRDKLSQNALISGTVMIAEGFPALVAPTTDFPSHTLSNVLRVSLSLKYLCLRALSSAKQIILTELQPHQLSTSIQVPQYPIFGAELRPLATHHQRPPQ
jgi:hypothetical protein